MKATFFNKPLEWNIETHGESWQQGSEVSGVLRVKNHGQEVQPLEESGVGFSHAEIKKVHSRADGALTPIEKVQFDKKELIPGEETELSFKFSIGPNDPVTDKKTSSYLGFGKHFSESNLQLKVGPKELYSKIIGLLDTFHRFKLKELKNSKKGVEFKLLPPTSREMANIDSLLLTFGMTGEELTMKFDFQVKKLDTSSITTKVNKESVSVIKSLSPREYSLGRDMINQDQILKSLESVLSEVKLKAVF